MLGSQDRRCMGYSASIPKLQWAILNIAGFKPTTEENGELFTCEEVAIWLRTLSKINKFSGLGDCAGEYSHRFVVETEKKQGWMWFIKQGGHCPNSMMTVGHYGVLKRFGFDRGTELYSLEGGRDGTLAFAGSL